MNTAGRQILSILLVLTISAAGLPMFNINDLNRDTHMDLEDAILGIQQVVQVAENNTPLKNGMAQAIATMQIAAGMRTVISKSSDSHTGIKAPGGSLQYLPVEFSQIPQFDSDGGAIFLSDIAIHSFSIKPNTPPPRNSVHC